MSLIKNKNYQQLEYIESNGTQYIDTGVNGSSGVSCDARVAWVNLPSNFGILGARKNSRDRIMLMHQYGSGHWCLSYGNTNMQDLGTIAAGTIYHVEAKLSNGEQRLKVDGVTLVSNTLTGDITNDFNLILFGCNKDGSPAYLSKSRIYNCKISTSNTLVRDFVPAKRLSDNVIGMIDTTNSGKNLFSGYEATIEAGKTYTISATLTAGTRKHIYTYDADGTQIRDLINWASSTEGYKTATFTANAGEVKCKYTTALDQVSELQLEEGSTATSYEPYDGFYTNAGTGTFIAGPEIREVVSYKSKLPYYPIEDIEGETTAIGTPAPTNPIVITSKQPYELNCLFNCGKVDLGTLAWTKNESYNTVRFLTPAIADINPPASNEGVGNIYLADFTVYSTNSLIGITSDGVALSAAKQISIRLNKYNDLSEAEFKAAMSGKILYYQRTTDSTWNPPIFDEYKVSGSKNLFNKATITANRYINSSGVVTSDGTDRTVVSDKINVKPSTTYTLSGVGDIYTASYGRSGYQYQADDTPISAISYTSASGTVSFTTASNCAYVRVMCVTENVNTGMLEAGSTATTYEPYIPPKGIIRRVGVKVFDGTERWSAFMSGFYTTFADLKSMTTDRVGLCTHYRFDAGTGGASNGTFIYNASPTNGNVTIRDDAVGTDVNDWKAYLAQQYVNGTPVKIYYPLATPVVETAKPAQININKSIISYYPTQDITGATTQSHTPAPTNPCTITSEQPYDLNCLFNCGKVDLGTLNWAKGSVAFYAPIPDVNLTSDAEYKQFVFTQVANSKDGKQLNDLECSLMVSSASAYRGDLFVRADGYTVEQFQQLVSGKILYYQRTTDSIWNAPVLDEYSVNGSKNLFNISALADSSAVSISGSTITINGTNISTGKRLIDLCPSLEAGKTYILYMSESSTTANKYIWLRSGAGGGQWSNNTTKTLTQEDLTIGAVKFYAGASEQTIVDMMIVEGSVAPTSYEPYIPPKGIIRRVGVKVLDGVTAGLKFNNVSSLSTFYYSSVTQTGIAQNVALLCTHFKNKNAVENGVCYSGNSAITFHHSFSTLTEANAWLASEYANGTPVKVYYPLATPVVESPKMAKLYVNKKVLTYTNS